MNRLVRNLVSLIGIAAVVFTQLAVSAYACPLQAGGADQTIDKVDIQVIDASGRDSAAPALCQKHCDNDQQTTNDSLRTLVFLTPAMAPAMEFPPVTALAETFRAAPPLPSLQYATSPPLSIRNCCFRI